MNNQILIVVIAFILFFIYLYFSNNKINVEKFTQDQQDLAQMLLDKFEKKEIPTFIKYMNTLIENKNIYDNLISKDVFNKFYNNQNLSIDDILKEMK